ncbi:TolC family outer membrane protein [Sphingomonas profundi]|uniref:TolC family outer membrane protein n=1 Tax=Alterirhizorhabdus profundi TaxID=2681549 RepID=UPI0012E85EFC|nr:TolC family outer membrane protein [Sphingomonas profundi]
MPRRRAEGPRLAAAWAVLAAVAAIGPAARAETLADAIATAYRTNPQLQAQRAGVRAVDEQLVQAKSGYGPTLTARVGRNYSSETNYLPNGRNRASATANSYTGTVDQPLFTSGRLSGGVRVAHANIDTARETLRQTEANVLTAVITAYVAVRRDRQLLGIAQENLALLSRQREDTDARLRGREATATDFSQTEVRVNFALARVKEATAALEVSRGQYLLAVGALPGDLAPEPPLAGMPLSLDQAYGVADENNPSLLAAMAREHASRAAIGTARAEFGPVVSLQASGGRDTVTQFIDSRRDFFVGGVVATVPVFNSGLTSSRVREAQKRNDQDWYLVDQTRREVRQAIAQSWDQMIGARGTIADYRNAVVSAEAAYAGAREQERAGVRTTLDVLDQTRDLLDARTALAQALANEYLTRANLLASMGVLEAPRLVEAVVPYDPQRNLRRVRDVLIPPYQPLLHAADAALQSPVRDRRPRDPAAGTLKPGSGPMPPAPAVQTIP